MVGVNEGPASITHGEKVRKSPFGSHSDAGRGEKAYASLPCRAEDRGNRLHVLSHTGTCGDPLYCLLRNRCHALRSRISEQEEKRAVFSMLTLRRKVYDGRRRALRVTLTKGDHCKAGEIVCQISLMASLHPSR